MARIATRGRRRTERSAWPPAAASATRRASSRCPAAMSTSPCAEIEPGGADVLARRDRRPDDHVVAIAVGVLLDRDGVGARRDRRAGEDAHRLHRPDGARKAGARRRCGRSPSSRAGTAATSAGAHGVAVHRRGGEGRLGAARGDVGGERAPVRRRRSPRSRPRPAARCRRGPGRAPPRPAAGSWPQARAS